MTAEKITAQEFAKQLKMPVDMLLSHFKSANMRVKEADQLVSPAQQKKLQAFLTESGEPVVTAEKPVEKPAAVEEKKVEAPKEVVDSAPAAKTEEKPKAAEPAAPKKITLRRKTTSQLKVTGVHGDKKMVNVKVVKKRTFVKRAQAPAEEVPAAAPEAPAPKAEEKASEKASVSHTVHKTSDSKPGVIRGGKSTFGEEKPTVITDSKKTKFDKPVAKKPVEASPENILAEEEKERQKRKKKLKAHDGSKQKKRKLDIRNISLDDDFEELVEEGAEGSRRAHIRAAGSSKHQFQKPVEPIVKEVKIPEMISVSDLAQRMSVKAAQVIKTLMKMGTMATVNQAIDQDTAILVVEEMGHVPQPVAADAIEGTLHEGLDVVEGEDVSRAPVVTIMGHVDHGKTTLLDHIRRTRVADGEAGGITQNIGAYHVETDKGMITFLDTPGHEAFTAMRARGAKVTDIVVLVVAADDGVMPQTIEAIQHAKAGGVPLIVAVNKIDKAEADPDRIKTELGNHEVIPEDWGGDTMFVHISAKMGQNIDELLDAILLQAEVLELKARGEGPAQGIVVEARLDKGRGVVASVLVQEGQLKTSDILLAGLQYGRVRAMLDENGHRVETAGPSIPVEILGLSDMPQAGDEMTVVATERKAREVIAFRQNKEREAKIASQKAAKLEDLFKNAGEGEKQTLKIVLKADVQGSVEALNESLLKLSNDEVGVEIIAKGVGGITGSDATLALASGAIIVGFNVRADNVARDIISKDNLDVHYHSIIYDAIDEVKRAVTGMLAPEFKEEIIGLAEVRDVFRSSKIGAIAGCMVIEGMIKRNRPIRVLRDNVVIFEGELESLRRFKDDVNEVKKGIECGIGVKDYNDIMPKDQIEVFESVKVERTL